MLGWGCPVPRDDKVIVDIDLDLGATTSLVKTVVCIIDKLCLLERPKPSWELLVGSPQARWAAGPPVAPKTGAVLRSSPFSHGIQSG